MGLKIYYEGGNQDYRFNKNLNFYIFFIIFLLCFFSLSSLIFSGGILEKDIFLEILFSNNYFLYNILLFFFDFCSTNLYSLKLVYSFFNFSKNDFFIISFFGFISFFFISFFCYYLLYFFIINFLILEDYFIVE